MISEGFIVRLENKIKDVKTNETFSIIDLQKCLLILSLKPCINLNLIQRVKK